MLWPGKCLWPKWHQRSEAPSAAQAEKADCDGPCPYKLSMQTRCACMGQKSVVLAARKSCREFVLKCVPELQHSNGKMIVNAVRV